MGTDATAAAGSSSGRGLAPLSRRQVVAGVSFGVTSLALPVAAQAASSASPVPPSAPAQVSGLTTTAGDASVGLSWLAPDDGGSAITAYESRHSSDGGSTWTEWAATGSTATSTTVSGLENGTAYVFEVRALNGVGAGTASQTSAAIVPSGARTFAHTGAAQSYTVPAGVTSLTVQLWGAQGYSATNYAGGLGGYATGTLAVTPGSVLGVYVGGRGIEAIGNRVRMGGGFNGGGDGQNNGTGSGRVGGGGGASDIRVGGSALSDRVVVAGGGGGATNNTNCTGGAGGGTVGGDAGGSFAGRGTGGTQVAGGDLYGALGVGGSPTDGQTPWNGGGGGGYFGGGTSQEHAGGGGGSSYLGGVTGGSTSSGQRAGDGLIVITPVV